MVVENLSLPWRTHFLSSLVVTIVEFWTARSVVHQNLTLPGKINLQLNSLLVANIMQMVVPEYFQFPGKCPFVPKWFTSGHCGANHCGNFRPTLVWLWSLNAIRTVWIIPSSDLNATPNTVIINNLSTTDHKSKNLMANSFIGSLSRPDCHLDMLDYRWYGTLTPIRCHNRKLVHVPLLIVQLGTDTDFPRGRPNTEFGLFSKTFTQRVVDHGIDTTIWVCSWYLKEIKEFLVSLFFFVFCYCSKDGAMYHLLGVCFSDNPGKQISSVFNPVFFTQIIYQSLAEVSL